MSRACPPGVCPGAASAGSRGGQDLRCPSGRGGHGGEDAARGERPLSLGAEAGGREGTPELAPKPLVGLSGGSSGRTLQAGQRKWRCEGQKQRGVTAGVGWGAAGVRGSIRFVPQGGSVAQSLWPGTPGWTPGHPFPGRCEACWVELSAEPPPGRTPPGHLPVSRLDCLCCDTSI